MKKVSTERTKTDLEMKKKGQTAIGKQKKLFHKECEALATAQNLLVHWLSQWLLRFQHA